MKYNVNKNNAEITEYKNTKYYGQWETDKIIEQYFKSTRIGNCIEIGAADGIKGSNTKYFENLGWNTLCIEPNPGHKESLQKHRKLVRYYAVGKDPGQFDLTVFKVGDKNIMSSLTSLSPDKRLVKAHSHIINDSYKVTVQVQTLSWILQNETKETEFENITKIDFISIDTEGTELDVLIGFDFEKYDVSLFVIENNYEDDDIDVFMKTKGYVKDQRYKINDFYIKNKIWT